MTAKKRGIHTLFFISLFLASIISATFKLPLIWDGAGYATFNLAANKATVLHDRLSVAFIQAPTIFSTFFNSFSFSLWVFNITYALVPFISLFFTYLILNHNNKLDLFIWPVLHITTSTVWMQMFYVSESLIFVQLFWILLAALLTSTLRIFETILFSSFLFFLHPISSPIFVLTGFYLLCLRTSTPGYNNSKKDRLIGVIFIISGLFRALIISSKYESSALSINELIRQLSISLNIYVVLGVLLSIALAFLLHIQPIRKVFFWVIFITLSLVEIYWASMVSQWRYAFEFRSLLLPLSLIYYTSFIYNQAKNSIPAYLNGINTYAVIVFMTVLFIQGRSWNLFQSDIKLAMKDQKCCASLKNLSLSEDHIIRHWGNDFLGILLQDSKTPKNLFLMSGCDKNSDELIVGDVPLRNLRRYNYLLRLEHLCEEKMSTQQQ